MLPFLRNLVHFLRTSDANIRLVYHMGLISGLSIPVKLLLVACWEFREILSRFVRAEGWEMMLCPLEPRTAESYREINY